MADSRIQDLTPATTVNTSDRFVLEQSGQAKSLTGQVLINDLTAALDGHGGISDISYTAPVSPSLNGTLDITLADSTSYSLPVTNGNGIDSIAISYGLSNQGTTPGAVTNWTQAPIPPTDANPYQWTRIRMTDKTGTVTDAYAITMKAESPTLSVGTVTATSGANTSVEITATGPAYDPVLNFAFTLPKGDKGDLGDYIDPVDSFGVSTAAATEPSTWYSSPSSLPYSAGNFIWQKTEYTLHDAQTVQKTEKKVIGYIGQNGSGSGTVTQVTFNNAVFPEDGTGNVPITVDAEDVGAIADPTSKNNGQVLSWDSTAEEWVAVTPVTGSVDTVNSVGPTVGTKNIQLYGTAIPMSSSDNRSVQSAIPTKVSDLTNDSAFISASGAPVQSVDGGTGAVNTWTQRYLGSNPINGTVNDTVSNWTALGTGYAWYDENGTFYGKVGTWGLLFNIVVNSEIFQIWKEQANGDIYWRSGNHGTAWTADSWNRLANVPRKATVTIPNNWTNTGNGYTSTATVSGATITGNSKVDLLPDSTVISELLSAGCAALYIDNNGGTLTAYAAEAAPTSALTIQCTVTEVAQ